MATFESAYKSLLQGVSQQPAEARLPGQVSSQLNMQSDPVSNLRRRYGCRSITQFPVAGATQDSIQAWYMDIAGALVHILIDANTGTLRVFDSDWVLEGTLTSDYLKATNSRSIRVAPVGNELYIGNVEILPVLQNTPVGLNPRKSGFFYVLAGAFSKSYSILVNRAGRLPYTVTYTTPNGTAEGDAALAVPEYIVDQLAQAIRDEDPSGPTVYVDGPYCFLSWSDDIVVNSSTGKNYLIVSKASSVLDVGELPARLPEDANGYNCRVGIGEYVYYYRYQADTNEWIEVGEYGGPSGITNAPISLFWNGTAWALNETAYDGRNAGDSLSNPTHEWIEYGISGIGTYQGRLVILSGPMVSLSVSNKPRKFFRTTVSGVLNSDPIEVGANAASAASYEWCMPFQKDLVLFSATHQAVLPSGNVGVTPSTATVVPTSGHAVDTQCEPVIVGRTVLYSKPRSEDFFGFMELVPSSYTDSQYTSQDITQHLPLYMPGRCRFGVSSSTASVALFSPSGDDHSLIVHEYYWDGDTKIQQAWHQWTFPYPIAAAYFATDKVILVFVSNGYAFIATVDPRIGKVNSSNEFTAYLDFQRAVTYADHTISIPSELLLFDPDIGDKLMAVVGSGPDRGSLIGTTYDSDNQVLITDLSHPGGNAVVGIPYRSSVMLTPPILVDQEGNPIYTGKLLVNRYSLNTSDSSQYKVLLSTDDDMGTVELVPTLYMDSSELQLGYTLDAGRSKAVVPARVDARKANLEVFTDGPGSLTIQSVEYVLNYNAKYRRSL